MVRVARDLPGILARCVLAHDALLVRRVAAPEEPHHVPLRYRASVGHFLDTSAAGFGAGTA